MPNPVTLTIDQRRQLMDQASTMQITLDGKPAKICGALNDFATVATLDRTQQFEWSWITVKRIVEAGGQVKSNP